MSERYIDINVGDNLYQFRFGKVVKYIVTKVHEKRIKLRAIGRTMVRREHMEDRERVDVSIFRTPDEAIHYANARDRQLNPEMEGAAS